VKLALMAVAAIAIAVAHPLCNLFFRCGCGWLGPAHCNIHQAMGPHCPWCVSAWRFPFVLLAWALGAWSGARLVRGRGALAVGASALGGLLIAAVASGALTSALTGYPFL
jgi:hypothetical protein